VDAVPRSHALPASAHAFDPGKSDPGGRAVTLSAMTINEALRIVIAEDDNEVNLARQDLAFSKLVQSTGQAEYDEIDQLLAVYVLRLTQGEAKLSPELTDADLLQVGLIECFRLGMRTQRKIDHPDAATTMFWRSDKTAV